MGSLLVGNSLLHDLSASFYTGTISDNYQCLHHHIQADNQSFQFITQQMGSVMGQGSQQILELLQPCIIGDIPYQPRVAYISMGSTDLLQGNSPSQVADHLVDLALDMEYNLQIRDIIVEGITPGSIHQPHFTQLASSTNEILSTLTDSYGFHLHQPQINPYLSSQGPTLAHSELPQYWDAIVEAITALN